MRCGERVYALVWINRKHCARTLSSLEPSTARHTNTNTHTQHSSCAAALKQFERRNICAHSTPHFLCTYMYIYNAPYMYHWFSIGACKTTHTQYWNDAITEPTKTIRSRRRRRFTLLPLQRSHHAVLCRFCGRAVGRIFRTPSTCAVVHTTTTCIHHSHMSTALHHAQQHDARQSSSVCAVCHTSCYGRQHLTITTDQHHNHHSTTCDIEDLSTARCVLPILRMHISAWYTIEMLSVCFYFCVLVNETLSPGTHIHI